MFLEHVVKFPTRQKLLSKVGTQVPLASSHSKSLIIQRINQGIF